MQMVLLNLALLFIFRLHFSPALQQNSAEHEELLPKIKIESQVIQLVLACIRCTLQFYQKTRHLPSRRCTRADIDDLTSSKEENEHSLTRGIIEACNIYFWPNEKRRNKSTLSVLLVLPCSVLVYHNVILKNTFDYAVNCLHRRQHVVLVTILL